MISVENFYWVLDKHLLRPTGLHNWYYFPWGTKDHFSQWEYTNRTSRSDISHVLFHFDQEPIYDESLGYQYDHKTEAWGHHRWAKFLANSERSQLKKQICQNRHMLDWYFFYHGFAALDWYRDASYIDDEYQVENAYLCMNHLVRHRRSYRMALMARLLASDLARPGSISFHADQRAVDDELADPHTRLSDRSLGLVRDTLQGQCSLPWTLDRSLASGELSATFGRHEHRLWQQSFMHVVTETVFYEPKLHLTEKTFKPIVALRPFMLVAAPGNLAYLRGYGFQTFDRWIDESYDTLQDHDSRLDAIVREIGRLQSLPLVSLRRMLTEMQSVLNHNRQHFFGRFKEIIVDELVDNFDRCVRTWNNGRIDDHSLCRLPNLESVKQRLKQ